MELAEMKVNWSKRTDIRKQEETQKLLHKIELDRKEKENNLKTEKEEIQKRIESEKEERWKQINQQWRNEAQEQNKKDIENYKIQLQEQKIPVFLLNEAEIFIASKFWGMKISKNIIFNKCGILI